MKIKFILILLLTTSYLYSQDAAFSQFYSAPVFLNPSLAGGDNSISVNTNYRTNTNFSLFPYQLGQFTISIPVLINSRRFTRKNTQLENYIGSIALTAYNEYIGFENEYRVSGLNITTSYFTQIAFAHFLSFGLQAGVIDKAINFNKLTWGSQFTPDIGYDSRISPSLVLINENNFLPVINAGLTWFYNIRNFSPYDNSKFRAFAGLAFSNLNRPDDAFYNSEKVPLPVLLKFHGGLTFVLSDKFELLPNCLVMRQNNVNHINIGTYIAYYLSENNEKNSNFYQIQLGSWYRIGDSYIISLGFEMKNLVLGISYDLNVSNYKYNNKGVRTLEISLKYKSDSRTSEGHRSISHPII